MTRTERRRLWRLAGAAVLASALVTVGSTPSSAVHDTGAFELDGNATNDPAVPGDDWDNVCHEVLGTDCSTSNDTSGAIAVSWSNDGAQNASIFTTGGSKDPEDLTNWQWKDQLGGLPDKDNLQNSFAARYSLPATATCPNGTDPPTGNCEVLFFGSDRFDNSGDAQQGFWFFQKEVQLATTGANAGKFVDSDGNLAVHTVGDILVLTNFSNGGGTSTIGVFEWVGTGGDTNGSLQSLGGGTNRTCSAALPTGDGFCGIVNSANGTPSPWPFLDKSGNTTYLQGEFFEGGVNLSLLPGGIADECFASFLSESRSSTSITATLKDFVLGTFAPCVAEMTTMVSNAGPVIPTQAVHDTATVVGSNPAKTPTGDVTFFLCGPIATGACDSGGTNLGTGPLSGSGATASATSPDVNTAASPLTPGRYCFRAEWPGDANYVGELIEFGGADGTNECFTVAKLNSATVTTPVDGSGVETHSITLGGSIFDKAVVTGEAAGGDPTGDVTFFICGPIASGTCSTGGTQVGSPVGLVSDGVPATFTSSATSAAVTPTAVGRYCFRADYGGSSIYNASSDSGLNECFTVNDTTAAASAQVWLPNDSATITSAHGAPINGSLSFTLHAGLTCTGAVLRPAESFTLSGASPQGASTTNSTVTVSATADVSWEVVFTSTNPNVSGSSRCESTSLTILN